MIFNILSTQYISWKEKVQNQNFYGFPMATYSEKRPFISRFRIRSFDKLAIFIFVFGWYFQTEYIRIRIRFLFLSRIYLYSGFLFEPNIFVFAFGFYFWAKYICIRIRVVFFGPNIFVFVLGGQNTIRSPLAENTFSSYKTPN